jgi:hypothetical protein
MPPPRPDVIVMMDRAGMAIATLRDGKASTKPFPPDLDAGNAASLGSWLKGELSSTNEGSKSAVGVHASVAVLLARSELSQRWIDLPDGMSDPIERASAIRLQTARVLGLAGEDLVIDAASRRPAASASSKADRAWVGAMTTARTDWWKQVISAAGGRLTALWSRAEAAASLATVTGEPPDGAVLVVVPGVSMVELVLAERRDIIAVKSVEWGSADRGPDEPAIQRVVQEAKRLVGAASALASTADTLPSRVAGISVIGGSSPVRVMAHRLGLAFDAPVRMRQPSGTWSNVAENLPVDAESKCSWEDDVASAALALADGPTDRLNLASPRRLPDRHAKKRQLALLGVFAAIVLGGGGWLLGQRNLASLRSSIADAQQRRDALAATYNSMLLSDARAKHLERWLQPASFGWLQHLRWLSDEMPHPSRATLDEFRGVLAAPVAFMSKDGEYRSGVWSVSPRATITLSGSSRDREIANDLRSRLVSSQVYGVESQGADVSDRFVFELTTSHTVPLKLEGPSPVIGEARRESSKREKPSGEGGTR